MQQTSFPTIFCIVDDASNDGEPEVIKSFIEDKFYLADKSVIRNEETDDYEFFFSRHKDNENCFFAVFFLKYNHYSIKKSKLHYLSEWKDNCRYIAVCEGDDWWTNPQKLQMQVDFLESNPDYVLCYGNVDRYDSDREKKRGDVNIFARRQNLNETKSPQNRFYKVLKNYYHIQNLTALYRRSALENRPAEKYYFMMGDTNLWLFLSQQGNFHYIEDCLGVYNIHNGSATHSPEVRCRFTMSKYEMRCYYCNEYGYEIPNIIKKLYNRSYINILMKCCEIRPQPIYEPYYRNRLQWLVLQTILKQGTFFQFYKHFIHPIKKRMTLLFTRFEICVRIVGNLVSM